MAAADARMLRAALLLRRFTVRELAGHAEVPTNTANSWIKRNRRCLSEHACNVANHRGRPPKIWLITDQGITKLQASLAEFKATPTQLPSTIDAHSERLCELAEEWEVATRLHDQPYQDEISAAARMRIRAAWKSYEEMHSLGYVVPPENLDKLAQIERTLGIGDWWSTTDLPLTALWLAGRFRTMRDNGIKPEFSACVLCARARARGHDAIAQLTMATLGLQVWFDESPSHRLTDADVRACLKILDVVPVRSQLSDALDLLAPARPAALQAPREQRQAIVLGLASAHPRDEQVTTWLLSLDDRDCWSDELAPAVAYGAADRPHVQLQSLIKSCRPSLQRAVEGEALSSGIRAGRIRQEAHQFACKALLPYTTDSSRHAGPATSADLAQVAAYFGSAGLP